MITGSKGFLLVLLFSGVLIGFSSAEIEGTYPRLRTAPLKNVGSDVIDGSVIAHILTSDSTANGSSEEGNESSRVSVTTVAFFTLAMAAATGLGSIPFFFVELDSQWSGICNGMAVGVMLAASFDLIQEGQNHGSGSWVVFGILAGGMFIWLCKKVMPLDLSFASYFIHLCHLNFNYFLLSYLNVLQRLTI